MNDWFTSALEFLDSLWRVPGLALVALSCIVFGYVLRLIKKFPNDAIPLAVIFWAIIATWFLAPPRAPEDAVLAWRARQILVGMIVGYGTWMFHARILKKIESKVPFLNSLLAASDSDGKPPEK